MSYFIIQVHNVSTQRVFTVLSFFNFLQVVVRCVNTFGLSISMLVNIVLPKIRRVLSGEKVVLTHLLNQGVGRDDDAAAMNRRPTAMMQSTPTTPMYTAADIIKLKREDPLPPSLEREIFAVQSLLGQVSKLWYVRTTNVFFFIVACLLLRRLSD